MRGMRILLPKLLPGRVTTMRKRLTAEMIDALAVRRKRSDLFTSGAQTHEADLWPTNAPTADV